MKKISRILGSALRHVRGAFSKRPAKLDGPAEILVGSQMRGQAAPRPLIDPNRKLMLFWMHRCGSTTAQLWFFEAAGWQARIPGKGASQIAPLWYAEHATLYQDLDAIYRQNEYRKIAVVRDPFARVVSAFSVVTDTISGAQWRAVSRSVKEPDDERRLTFLEFLTFLETIDLSKANFHWRLQTAQDWYEKKLTDVLFARVEHLQEDLNRISEDLGISQISIRRSSATTKVTTSKPGVDVTRLTRYDLAKHFGRDRRGVIRFPDYQNFLTDETIPRIVKLYARDFEVLGYAQDPREPG